MHRITRSRQRLRLHTEDFLTHQQPLLTSGSRRHFGSLTDLWETSLQPESQWASPPFSRAEVVTLVQQGHLQFASSSGDREVLTSTTAHRFTAYADAHICLINDSDRETARYLQIWFELKVGCERKSSESQILEFEKRRETLIPIASGQNQPNGLQLLHDTCVYVSRLRPSENLIFETLPTRRVFLLILRGLIRLDEHRLQDLDSAMIWKESSITLAAQQTSSLLLIDLA